MVISSKVAVPVEWWSVRELAPRRSEDEFWLLREDPGNHIILV